MAEKEQQPVTPSAEELRSEVAILMYNTVVSLTERYPSIQLRNNNLRLVSEQFPTASVPLGQLKTWVVYSLSTFNADILEKDISPNEQEPLSCIGFNEKGLVHIEQYDKADISNFWKHVRIKDLQTPDELQKVLFPYCDDSSEFVRKIQAVKEKLTGAY